VTIGALRAGDAATLGIDPEKKQARLGESFPRGGHPGGVARQSFHIQELEQLMEEASR
jgi:hypothetical protein